MSLLLPSLLRGLLASVDASPKSGEPSVPKGFVTTKGSSFELDGKYFVCECVFSLFSQRFTDI